MNDLWFTESLSNLFNFCDSKDCLDGISPSLLLALSDSLGLEMITAPSEVPSHLTGKDTLCYSSILGGKQKFPTLTGDKALHVQRDLVRFEMWLLICVFRGIAVPDSFSISLERGGCFGNLTVCTASNPAYL